jgi:cell division protein FtsB
MRSNHRLRKQVNSELKRRRYIISTLLLLSLLYFGVNLVFNDTGLLRHLKLKEIEAALETDLNETVEENVKLKAALESYKNNNYYIEKHAREEFGLAGPDEYIFIYK